ncbi:MAG: VanZ family protein [Alphaproteobacteria bacterium]
MICLSVSVGDEVFQWLLPDRVGDPRDVAMNIAACLLGVAVALVGGETT